MSSFACTMLLVLVAVSHFKQILAGGINDCPKFDCEYKLLERVVKTDYVQKEMENALLQLQKEVTTLKTSLEERDIAIRKHLDNESKRIESKVIGFSVSSTGTLAKHQLIVFNDVIYDPYKAYDRNTGIYTVPVSGTYFITGSIYVPTNNHVQTEIIAGGQSVTRMYAYSPNSSEQGANSVVVDLKAGSTIFMRVEASSSGTLYGNRWTSMSAVCLKPDLSAS
ncbi:hypothetical protein CHS0354_034041 [Potamilus streckersoni]|uniref:C1q domain-containing protein n=1 Tax=Potamilus streckersoni TaxID=2493646 RepID=A0AAE0TI53_9BIVA|nr:hypothetical protein CHS0354_034041 [Potamilus streckersoni]